MRFFSQRRRAESCPLVDWVHAFWAMIAPDRFRPSCARPIGTSAVKVGTRRQSTTIEKRTSARRRCASSNCDFEPVQPAIEESERRVVDRQTDHDAIMRGRVDVPVLREMAGSRVGVTEGLREGVLVVDHSAPASDTRPNLSRYRPAAGIGTRPSSSRFSRKLRRKSSFERVHLIRDIRARSSGCPFPGATDALSRSPLSLAFRPFIRSALKGSSGSTVRIAGTTPRLHNLRCAPRGCCKPIRSCRRDGEKVTAAIAPSFDRHHSCSVQ